MLADDDAMIRPTGRLSADLELPAEWRTSFCNFLAASLPLWRDDPARPSATAETVLTSQLCAFLNSMTRQSRGWDYLQFRVEEPDESVGNRSIDLVAAPSGVRVSIEGRRYSQYEALLPMECKRLPTPPGKERDEREYLYSQYGSRGGVQRFKAGHHGAAHVRAALIAYVQGETIDTWQSRMREWISALSTSTAGWTEDDALVLQTHDAGSRLACLSSRHARQSGLAELELDHLWIEM